MKSHWLASATGVFAVVILSVLASGAQPPPVSSNPAPFQHHRIGPSGPFRFMLSERGKELLSQSNSPQAKGFLKLIGKWQKRGLKGRAAPVVGRFVLPGKNALSDVQPQVPQQIMIPPHPLAAAVSPACGASGQTANLEKAAGALPQNEESVDFFLGGGVSGADLVVSVANDFRGFLQAPGFLSSGISGYYVHDTAANCLAQYEGSFYPMTVGFGAPIPAFGDSMVQVNPTNGNVYAATLIFDPVTPTTTGIGVYATNKTTLLNTATCPAGTHNDTQAMSCWPTTALLNALNATEYLNDKPALAVDTRASGVGAGDIYITGTLFSMTASNVFLIACKSDLSACSNPIYFNNDADTQFAQFSDVRIRSDGIVSVTFIDAVPNGNTGLPPNWYNIKYASCRPMGAPFNPSCGPATLVYQEKNALQFDQPLGLAANSFRVGTYPVHTQRTVTINNVPQNQAFVTWARCATPTLQTPSGSLASFYACANADIMAALSTNNGGSWTVPFAIANSLQNTFFPWIGTDPSTKMVNIAYYSDNGEGFKHRLLVQLSQIPASAITPNPAINIDAALTDPAADPYLGDTFYGDYIGLSANGTGVAGQSKLYVGYTSNFRVGNYSGANSPQQDNFMSLVNY